MLEEINVASREIDDEEEELHDLQLKESLEQSGRRGLADGAGQRAVGAEARAARGAEHGGRDDPATGAGRRARAERGANFNDEAPSPQSTLRERSGRHEAVWRSAARDEAGYPGRNPFARGAGAGARPAT